MVKPQIVWLVTFSILFGSGCRLHSEDTSATKIDPKALFPIVKNGKWGYINGHGHVVIEPQFERATPFTEGLAPVKLNGKWGYIDSHGIMVIMPQYAAALHFSEGIALVSYDDFWKKGTPQMFYLPYNTSAGGNAGAGGWVGNIKDSPSIDDDGFNAGGRNGGLRFAYIDKQGRSIFERSLDYAFSFHEGLASVSIDNKASFINPTGVIALQGSFGTATSFSEGLAKVSQQKTDRWGEAYQLWGYMDKSGKLAIEPQFVWAGTFSEGLAAELPYSEDVRDVLHRQKVAKSGQRGIVDLGPVPIQYPEFIDWSGRMVTRTNTVGAKPFKEGLACVGNGINSVGDGNGFINRTGQKVVDCGTSKACAESFSEGLALFLVPGSQKTGFIDHTGKVIIPPDYDYAESFHDDLALVRIGGKFVLKDSTGQYVDRLGMRYVGAKIGYINKSGKYIWKPTN